MDDQESVATQHNSNSEKQDQQALLLLNNHHNDNVLNSRRVSEVFDNQDKRVTILGSSLPLIPAAPPPPPPAAPPPPAPAPPPPSFPYVAVIGSSLTLALNVYVLTNVFPYAGYLITWFDIAGTTNEAGFYSGFLVSSFMFGRVLTSLLWGVWADEIGRKPVLLFGCFALAVLQLLFGTTRSFYSALVYRFLMGLCNGLVGTAKTVGSELVPGNNQKSQAKAMSYISAGASVASFLGPAIGGFLSDPATTYGGIFDTALLRQYPYILPNIFGFCFSILCSLWVYFLVPETLPQPKPLHLCGSLQHTATTYKSYCCLRAAGFSKLVQSNDESRLSAVTPDDKSESQKLSPHFSDFYDGASNNANSRAKPEKYNNNNIVRRMGNILLLLNEKRVRTSIAVYSMLSFSSIYLGEIFPLWCIASTCMFVVIPFVFT